MAQTEYRDVLSVDFEKLYSVILRYEDYPKFVQGCESVRVESLSNNITRVHYQVNVMSQEINYVLDHTADRDKGKIEWNLVESNFFKKNIGRWELRNTGSGKTEALYFLDIEFKIPVPGFVLSRLVKGSLPGMVKNFEKQAQKS